MQRVYTPGTGYCADAPAVIALGNFDGVHVGHAALLRRAAQIAREMGIPACALIFDRDPENVMASTCISPYITSNDEKARQIHKLGIDRVIYIPFDRATASLSPAEFVLKLKTQYRAQAVVCGFHYRFGYRAAGDAEDLKALCGQSGIDCEILSPVTRGGLVVSSTVIRNLIRAGNMDFAAQLLGRPYAVEAVVEQGKRLGRDLGFPTVNQHAGECALVPAYGVYATRALARGRWYPAVTNVGVRPTVERTQRSNIETHIIGINEMLYGETVRVEFYHMLRGEQRFRDVEALKAAVRANIDDALAYFAEKQDIFQ